MKKILKYYVCTFFIMNAFNALCMQEQTRQGVYDYLEAIDKRVDRIERAVDPSRAAKPTNALLIVANNNLCNDAMNRRVDSLTKEVANNNLCYDAMSRRVDSFKDRVNHLERQNKKLQAECTMNFSTLSHEVHRCHVEITNLKEMQRNNVSIAHANHVSSQQSDVQPRKKVRASKKAQAAITTSFVNDAGEVYNPIHMQKLPFTNHCQELNRNATSSDVTEFQAIQAFCIPTLIYPRSNCLAPTGLTRSISNDPVLESGYWDDFIDELSK